MADQQGGWNVVSSTPLPDEKPAAAGGWNVVSSAPLPEAPAAASGTSVDQVQPPAPAPAGLPHPDVVNALTTQHANTLATAVLNPPTPSPGGVTIGAAPPPGLWDRLTDVFAGPGSLLGNTGKVSGSGQILNPDLPLADLSAYDKDVDKALPGHPILRGVTKGVLAGLSGLTTPANAALLVATYGTGSIPVIGRIISAGFSADMLISAGRQSPLLVAQIKAGDLEGAAQTATSMGINVGMALMSGHHAVRGKVEPLPTKEAQDVTSLQYNGEHPKYFGPPRLGEGLPPSAPPPAPPVAKAPPKKRTRTVKRSPAPPAQPPGWDVVASAPLPAEAPQPAEIPPPEVVDAQTTTHAQTLAEHLVPEVPEVPETPTVKLNRPLPDTPTVKLTRPPPETPTVKLTRPPKAEAPAKPEGWDVVSSEPTPEVKPEPAKKPVTPQVPGETKYVLPGFVTAGLEKGGKAPKVPEVPEVPAKGGLEPHQMTRADYVGSGETPGSSLSRVPIRRLIALAKKQDVDLTGYDPATSAGRNQIARAIAHKGIVRDALKKGEPVPESVLASYPDLTSEGQSKGARPAETDARAAKPRTRGPKPVSTTDSGPLGGIPAADGGGTPGGGQAPGSPSVSGQPHVEGVLGSSGAGPVSGSGGGDHAGDVDVSVPGTPRPPRPRKPLDTRPRLTGYRITAADHLGEGSLQEKALQNVEAIRTMKLVEGEGRPATLEEQRKLVKYTGWGALSGVFEPYQSTPWERAVRAELQDMLTTDEWKTAAATTPNAHYTSEPVIRAIWGGVQRLGIKAGHSILEPSMGSGNFFGLIPDALIPDTKLAGVELDPVTARIAALLYPNAGTYASGFEKTKFPDNWFDLAISNVPFGNYGVYDSAFNKGVKRPVTALTSSIHNYFFAKALDKVRPGGIVAFITSKYTMDTKDTTVREYLSKEAKLIAAFRLPQTAFEKNAGTTVVTDIIFLQKRVAGDASEGETWTTTSPTDLFPGDRDNPHLNDYYKRHPDHILGTVKGNRGRFGPELNVLGQVTPQQLMLALMHLPENIVPEYNASEAFKPDAIAFAEYTGAQIKQGAYGLHDGKLVRRAGDMLEPQTLPKETEQRVTGMIGVRDAMHEVFRTQLADKPETEIVAARKALNKVYDKFVARWGNLSDPKNSRAFRDDPDAQPILALEKIDPKTKAVSKTDIFTQQTLQTYHPVTSAGNAKEAMTVSLNEYGRINWPRMAQLTGLSPEDMQEELGDLIFRDPDSRQWMPADEYLSGDIRQKLAQAKDLAKADPDYQRNVTALEAAKPPDLHAGEIKARLGAPWIPPRDVEQFVAELLKINPSNVSVAYSPAIATWRLVLTAGQAGAKNTAEWAGGDIPAHELIEDAMNMKVPTVRVKISSDPDKYAVDPKRTAAAQDMQQKLKNRFSEWIWESPTRTDRLEKLYNDSYNGIRLREYDGSHLSLPGANPAITLRPHQKNAIWRIVSSGRNTLLAHVVGAGKTFEMIGGAMELRRLGLAKKPMLTVPANIVGQIGRDFRLLYPAANILVADEETFSAKNRQKAMAQVATGNWDAVVISHDAFGLLPVADETFNSFLQKEIDTLEDAIRETKKGNADKKIQKELEKSKKRLEAKLRKRADREGKDDSLTFEQLGVDALFVDEADMFKNLYFTTRATRIAGIPNSESNRAFDMLIKSRHVTDKTGGRLVFATGTPIANTVAEMYTMLRYLSHKELDSRSLGQFDAWAQQFGESVTGLETSPDGAGFRVNTRFAKFSNLPELQNLFRQVADVQTADMLKLPVPKLFNGKYETISVPASQTLLDYIMAKDEQGNFLPGTLMGRIAAIKSGKVDPKDDNMLKVTSDGRKAALDLRLIGVNVDPPDSKVNTAVSRIFEIWEQGKADRTTQMVFSDLSTPNKERWNVYDEIRRKLTLKGVPAEEIAYAHDADTEEKKKVLIAKVNEGKVRILIGSTGKMGAGTNAQARLIALHHLDVPWRPRDVEQREGRILRQGNMNPEVHIIRYVTAPSFDAYMWGLVTRKARFIEQVMTGKLGVREAEDIGGDSLGAAEAEAAATGNPLIKEKADIDNQVMRLSALSSEHARKQISARIDRDRLQATIERSTVWIPRLEADIERRNANTPEKFSMTVGKKTYDERKAAGEALIKFATDRRMDEEVTDAGTYRGFTLKVQGQGAARMVGTDQMGYEDLNRPKLMFYGDATHYANLSDSGLGTLQSIDHEMKNLDRYLEQAHEEVQKAKADQKQYAITANTPFADGALLDKLVARQQEIFRLLDLGANAQPAADDTETETKPAKNPESGAASLETALLKYLGKKRSSEDMLTFPDMGEGEQGFNEMNSAIARLVQSGLVERDNSGSDPAFVRTRAGTAALNGKESGAASLDFLTLGLTKFIADDVAPAVKDVALGIRDTSDDILKVLAPTLRDRNAQTASLILRGKLAELARKSDQAQAALEKASRYFAHQPASENFDFIDRMELGQRQKTVELDQIAFTLRTLLDDRKADVQSLGTGKLQNFYKDYFPHIWKRPQRAQSLFSAFFGKRPLEGGKSFLKKRKLPTIADGLAVGLEPVTDNPVDLVLLKTREMDRYVMAHETLADWKANGLAKFVRGIKSPPKGWARIDDSISTVYGRTAAGETIVRGHYYAPEGAARIINGYLSPGLRKYAGYRAIVGLNNVLNQFQLGLSAFHLGFTAADTTVSKAALGFQALLTGHPLKAGKYLAQTPIAAFTTFMEGDRMLKGWYRPGSQGAAIGALVDNLVTAGGRARMDQMYRTEIGGKMLEALRKGNVVGAALRAPFAGVEWTSNLIMDQVVPRMKLGAFADMARFHMEQLGPSASFEDVRLALTRDWNSIENRLGEMTYDNLFWDKTAKDLAMITVRSVGWNLGTLREIGGGLADTVVQPANALRGKPVNLNRLSYLLGLVTVNAVMSATYQYLKTGKGPDELKDYFFPKNGETDEHGNPQRISWPTYVKDVYHYGTHPLRTLESKVAPIWSSLSEMIRNKDFYGVEIRNPDDPFMIQLKAEAFHTLEQFVPIGVRNFEREKDLGASTATKLEQFVGVSQAPADLDQGPGERMAHELAGGHADDEARTPEQQHRKELRNSLARSLRAGKGVPKEVVEARRSGILSKGDITLALHSARETPFEAAFLHLGIDDAIRVYKASTPAEKKEVQGMFMRKARAALGSAPPADRAGLLARVQSAIESPR